MKNQSVPLLPKKIIVALIFVAALCAGSIAHAQADRGGSGGDWSEADLKHFLTRLAPYLSSSDGQQVFPEVADYDRAHLDSTVEKVAGDLNPRLVNKSVYDSAGNERDCVSYTTPVRYFECNLNSLPRKPSETASDTQKSEYYGSMYRLVLHEVFVQVGIEKPLTKEVPSEYALSSRLMVHLESFPEWVPGAGANSEYTAQNNDVTIHTRPEVSVSAGVGGAYGNLLGGVGLKIRLPVTIGGLKFKVGMTTGYEHGFYNPGNWIIPMLGTVEIEFKPIFNVRPYFGIGGGSSQVRRSYQYSDSGNIYVNGQSTPYNNSYSFSDSDWNVTAQAVAGFNFGNKDQFFFEVPVCYFNLSWSFLPSFGVHF